MQLDRRHLLKLLGVLGIGSRTAGTAAAGQSHDGATLNRFGTTVTGSEITGLFVTDDGRLFFNLQDPERDNISPYNRAALGSVTGVSLADLPADFPSVQPSDTDREHQRVRLANGEYQILAKNGDETDDGKPFGIPTLPDGRPVGEAPGAQEKPYGTRPDFNAFVPADPAGTDEAAREGYLFSNQETKPGMITRLALSRQTRTGEWTVTGVANLEDALRTVEGTTGNCFGTRSPDGVPLSGEELYAETVTRFWNRPRPDRIGETVDNDDFETIDDDEFENIDKLASVEQFAAWLGDDQSGDEVEIPGGDEQRLFVDEYPNPYRLGSILALENPTADEPTDVDARKLWTLGRATHENAVVMPDRRTAYVSSDGTGKCFYKFVADEAVAGRGSVSEYLSKGTLYVARASQDGDLGGDPADVSFDIEWLELGHASLGEIESWIAEYDDITQADYMAIPETVDGELDDLEEIDEYVAEHGNPNYITPAEIKQWADQYDERGPGGVDEALRRVPFLESRRAARAIGATAEFRKLEGINIRPGAVPGEDSLWVAMSNTTQSMGDDEGDIQLDGSGFGAVYRLPLEADYDVRRMVPEVVGGEDANICGGCPYDARPDSASTVCEDCEFNPTREDEEGRSGSGLRRLAATAADRLASTDVDPMNTVAEPDNIVVMSDGRVVIGEDASVGGHRHDNMIWIYNPADNDLN